VKLGLAVHRAGLDRDANVQRMIELAERGASAGADLVLFCEAAATGFRINGDPEHDLALGEAIPGPTFASLRAMARRLAIWVAFGVLERTGGRLFDTAALIDRHGRLRLRYRRIDPHWHGPRADPAVYGEGAEIPVVEDEFGRVTFLICGDVFNDDVVTHLRAERPEIVLAPMARGIDTEMPDAAAWAGAEQPAYGERFGIMNTAGLVVNGLWADDGTVGCVGGAMAVDARGRVVAALPAHVEDVLVVDVSSIAGH
jgi:N-carbamoylputrescine amidase